MGQHGRVRQIVKAGVDTTAAEATDRSTDELRAMVRRNAERGIVAVNEMAKRELLTAEHVDMLAKCYRLLELVEGKQQPAAEDSDDKLFREAAKL